MEAQFKDEEMLFEGHNDVEGSSDVHNEESYVQSIQQAIGYLQAVVNLLLITIKNLLSYCDFSTSMFSSTNINNDMDFGEANGSKYLGIRDSGLLKLEGSRPAEIEEVQPYVVDDSVSCSGNIALMDHHDPSAFSPASSHDPTLAMELPRERRAMWQRQDAFDLGDEEVFGTYIPVKDCNNNDIYV